MKPPYLCPEALRLPVHLSGESYAGREIPNRNNREEFLSYLYFSMLCSVDVLCFARQAA
jgi:hypothetical protein